MPFPTEIDLHTAYEDDAPAAQEKVSAATLDADHLELERWINTVLLPALAQILRDDGTLTDALVRYRNLHPEVIPALTATLGSVQLAVPADGSVSTMKLALLAVTTGALNDLCVSTAKIAELAVTAAKLGDAAVATAKIADLGVTTAKIADAAVSTAKIADSGVTTAKIADSAVTNAKMAQVAAYTLKGNDTAATAAAKDLTVGESRALLGISGIEHLTASRSVDAPNATVPVHAMTPSGAESNVDVVIKPKGTGGVALAVADSAATGGNKRGLRAVDLQIFRNLADEVAASDDSAIIGGRANKVHPTTATGSVILAGLQCETDKGYNVVHGAHGKPRLGNARAHGALNSHATGKGASQLEENVFMAATMDATPYVVVAIPVVDEESIFLTAEVVAYQQGATNNAAGYRVRACAKRASGVGTLILVGVPSIEALEDNAAWDCVVTADAATGYLKISVTGAAGVTVLWVCTVRTTSVRRV